MDRYLTRSQSSVSILQWNLGPACTLIVEDSSQPVPPSQHALPSKTILTPELLVDINLQAFAQQLTRGIAQKVGKISRELGGGGEIDQLGERTVTLETKFNETIHYLQTLEEENACLKYSVSQLQLQQQDLENRERSQNFRICGVSEKVSHNIRSFLLGLFNNQVNHAAFCASKCPVNYTI